jgi:hypothetical protein
MRYTPRDIEPTGSQVRVILSEVDFETEARELDELVEFWSSRGGLVWWQTSSDAAVGA